jgi:hypothetical protein
MRRKKKRQPFKHRKLPGYPKGCYGFLKPTPSKPTEYLYCTQCGWMVSMAVAEHHGYIQEEVVDGPPEKRPATKGKKSA